MNNNDIEKVIIKDSEGKLYSLGFHDGKERASRILNSESNNENLENLNPIGVPEYLKGYKDGVKAAQKEFEKNNYTGQKLK